MAEKKKAVRKTSTTKKGTMKKVKTASPKSPTQKKSATTNSNRPQLANKCTMAKWGEVAPQWWIIDAEGQTLGRICTRIAEVLMGKNKPLYTPHSDTGDFVVVVNAEKIKLTGNKLKNKVYYHHTHFPGGIKEITAEKLLEKHPERVIKKAVHGMLPKTRLGRKWETKLKVFAGEKHIHEAQKPQKLELTKNKA